MKSIFNTKNFIINIVIVSIWIHITEILRAVYVAFPRMTEFFAGRMDIGPMAISNAIIWGIWDMMLTITLVFSFWLCAKVFGNNWKSVLISAAYTTMATLGIFWVASVNTGLGRWSTAAIILPIVLVEMVIGAFITSKLYARKGL